jgi:CelD/BcsL family acetyltransferase involved in cellulose biosynthesis
MDEIYNPFLKEGLSDIPFKKSVRTVDCIPTYLGIDRTAVDKDYKCFQSRHRLGFAIDLSVAPSAQDYLKGQLSKKVFRNLRQDRQRLEKLHEIHFKTYYGSILQETYIDLMARLKRFVADRFQGRTSRHSALKKWESYEKTAFEEINKRNASLFVVYCKDAPIAISLNYHFREVLNAAITSYDQDYYRFSMGRQMFFWQIDWCYANNYRLIDLGWGPFEYKVKFSNAVYRYYTHVIYPRDNFNFKALAFYYFTKMKLIYYLVMLRDSKLNRPEIIFKDRWLNYRITN